MCLSTCLRTHVYVIVTNRGMMVFCDGPVSCIEVDEQFIVNTQMLVTREYLPLTRQTVYYQGK